MASWPGGASRRAPRRSSRPSPRRWRRRRSASGAGCSSSCRRGEIKNWYSAPFDDRAAMMREHGHIGRRYAGKVVQIISGSIGFDDWEWGVDLFAEDPLTFKKLIYEMRFDEASAKFAEFGPFYVGLQFPMGELGAFLNGELPALTG